MLISDGGRPLATSLLLLLLLCSPGEGCGPGRGSGRRRRPKKLTPLVFKQHVPNVSENTLGASGLPDGPIKRGEAKFKDLVRNNNPDIIFKDEEGTGADRIMSQRCKDKLNILAVSVLNQWPGVKLRVTEAWDEDGMHAENSLHYEGRAVDITTSDRDRSKYGMLARLAVEAGFDWVYYETRGHIHCSVQSDSSIAINFGGCFPPTSEVITPSGRTISMSELQIGDQVLSVNQKGRFEFSEVIAFLDINRERVVNYYTLITQSGNNITLTAKHLIHATNLPFLARKASDDIYSNSRLPQLFFAENIQVGQFVLFAKDTTSNLPERLPQTLATYGELDYINSPPPGNTSVNIDNAQAFTLSLEKVVSIHTRPLKGTYAPLTVAGTIIVNNYVASCYAFLEDGHLAHSVFGPLRAYYWTKTFLSDWLGHLARYFDWTSMVPCFDHPSNNETIFHDRDGTHWYARFLYKMAVNIFGMDIYISL